MKNKRIWLIIGCILIAGVLITRYTDSFISSKESASATAAGAVSAPMEAGAAMAAGVEEQGLPDAGMGRSAPAAPPKEMEGINAADKTSETAAGIAAAEAAPYEADAAGADDETAAGWGPAAGQNAAGQGSGAAGQNAAGWGPAAGQNAAGQGLAAAGQNAADQGSAAAGQKAAGQGPAAGQNAAGQGPAAAAPAPEGNAGGRDEAAAPGAVPGPAAQTPASPLEGVNGRSERSTLAKGTDYRQRLVDLDNQIQKLREEDKDATAYTLKNTAESELKLWESEMSTVYNALLERMPQQEAADLAAEQQEWLKSREARAAEQNLKNSAANLESVGYITSLVSITRDRTYELVGRYEEMTAQGGGT